MKKKDRTEIESGEEIKLEAAAPTEQASEEQVPKEHAPTERAVPKEQALDDVVDSEGEGLIVDEELVVEDELTSLQSELDDIRTKAEEYLDGWQRARAEFANYKKRIEKERQETRSFITAEILSKYLTIVDDFERALTDRPADETVAAWAEGVEMIYRKLKNILDAEGVEVISAVGEPFDPVYHEAIGFEESEDHKEGEIVAVVQTGYKIGERVIRPATVKVAK